MEPENRSVFPTAFGVSERTTDSNRDPHLGKVMLYQLSHVRVPAAAAGARRDVPGVRTEL